MTADLINRYPDRFLFGTDVVAPKTPEQYFAVYEMYKPLWAKLTPEASEKVLQGQLRAPVRRRPREGARLGTGQCPERRRGSIRPCRGALRRSALRYAAAPAEVPVDKPVSDPNAIGRGLAHRLEIAVVIIISASALVTSWASYEANLWSRKQAVNYGLSGAHRVMATRAALDASVNRTMEVGLLNAWMAAREARNQRLATFYERRFPPEFEPAFRDWMAQRPFDNPQAAPSPFRLSSYRPPG